MDDHIIVVGAGTAGCKLSSRLAAFGTRVTLLEAGGSDRHMYVKMPAAFPKLFKTKRDWAYSTTPQSGLNARRVFWPRGKMLGGSSSMNAQIHQWCSALDFESWAREGAEGWGWDVMAPVLKRIDDELNGGRLRDPNPLTHAFLAAAAAEGLSVQGSYNGGVLGSGAWISEVAQRNGKRWNAADAYLRDGKGVEVVTDALVDRILFDGKGATGVTYIQGGETKTITGTRGLVVCAGTINSPQLLLRSGIGPANALKPLGIEIVTDLANVGENLQDHLMFVMHFRARRAVTLKSAESFYNLWRYITAGRGMLASNVAEGIAFAASAPGGPVDLEIVFAPALFENEGLSPPSGHGFSLAPVLLSPKSRGRISLTSRDPAAAPLIDAAYLTDPGGQDLARLVQGVKLAHRIASQSPLAVESAGMIVPKAMDEDAIVSAIRAQAHTIYHPVGTCRMGSDSASVVDCRLRVRGVEGLWVADASVMPTVPSGHPNAVVAAIADRAATFVAAPST